MGILTISNIPALSGNHAPPVPGNIWESSPGTKTGDITFNLNGSYSLAGFGFWNYNGINTRGIRGVTVQSSTDGVSFSAITGAPTQFAIGASLAATPAQQYSFSPVTASYVRFVVSSNWGFPVFTGFAEAQFDGTPAAPPTKNPKTAIILGLLAFRGSLLATKCRKG